MTCPNGHAVEPGEQYCGRCGAQVIADSDPAAGSLLCPSGHPVEAWHAFCETCGAKLVVSALPPTSVAQTATRLPATPAEETVTRLPPTPAEETVTRLPPTPAAETVTQLPPTPAAETETQLPRTPAAETMTQLPPTSAPLAMTQPRGPVAAFGQDATAPAPVAPAALPAGRRRGFGPWVAVGVALALILVVGGTVFLLNRPQPTSHAATKPAPSATPTLTSSPSPSTPVTTPLRVCWDQSQVTQGTACPLPSGRAGLLALSPTFRSAMNAGRCRTSVDNHTAGGFVCSVQGTAVHFAWFSSARAEDAHFAASYPDCRPLPGGDVLSCVGPNRASLRYYDRRLLFEITAPLADQGALLAVGLTDERQLR